MLPPLTVSYTGLVERRHRGQLRPSFRSVTTTATNSSHVAGSPYSITASGAVDSDYSISYVGRNLDGHPRGFDHHCS